MATEQCQQPASWNPVGARPLYVALILAAIISAFVQWRIVRISDDPRADSWALRVQPLQLPWMPAEIQSLQSQLLPRGYRRIEIVVFAAIGGTACCLFAVAVHVATRKRAELVEWTFPAAVAGHAFLAIAIGAVFGGAGGWLGSFAGEIHAGLTKSEATFIGRAMQLEHRGFMVHTLTWLMISAGIGITAALAFAGRVSVWRPMMGAAVGGMAAAALFPYVAALLFPNTHPEWLIPDGPANQLLWLLFSMLLMAIGVCRVLSRPVARW